MKGLNRAAGERICAARNSAHISNAKDLARRAGLDDQQLSFLARSGALAGLVGHRHQAHWDVTGIEAPLALERPQKQYAMHNENVHLNTPTVSEDMLNDYRYTAKSGVLSTLKIKGATSISGRSARQPVFTSDS